MSYKPYLQFKMKTSPKLGYSSNFSINQKNSYLFGMNKTKKNRDITPFRKYKQNRKKIIGNNINKNKYSDAPITNLKIEGDLISGSNFGIKRSKTPLNSSSKKNNLSKSPNN